MESNENDIFDTIDEAVETTSVITSQVQQATDVEGIVTGAISSTIDSTNQAIEDGLAEEITY